MADVSTLYFTPKLSHDMLMSALSCEHTGIACFTVRHKDAQGNWVENDQQKKDR